MTTLISLEFYKMSHKKSFYIGLALVLCFCTAIYISRVDPFGSRLRIRDRDGVLISGREAVELEKEQALQYRGALTDETVWKMYCGLMKEQTSEQDNMVQETSRSYPQQVLEQFFLPYTAREIIVNGERQTEAAGGTLEKDDLIKIDDWFPESVQPLEFGYSVPWSRMLQSLLAGMFVLNLFMIIVVSPLFAEEHTKRMNAILFTSKYGRKKCFFAKAAAAFLIGLLSALGIILLHVLVTLALFGGEGLSCSIQLTEPFIFQWVPYAKTVGAVLIDAICLYIADILLTLSMTVLASVLATHVLTAAVYSLVLFWVPGFLMGASSGPQLRWMFPVARTTHFEMVLQLPHWNIGFVTIQYSHVITGVFLAFCVFIIWGAWKLYAKMPEEGFGKLTDYNNRNS